MSRVYLEENNIPILEAGRMKTEDKMCSLEKIRSECFLLIYILELSKWVTRPDPARPTTVMI